MPWEKPFAQKALLFFSKFFTTDPGDATSGTLDSAVYQTKASRSPIAQAHYSNSCHLQGSSKTLNWGIDTHTFFYHYNVKDILLSNFCGQLKIAPALRNSLCRPPRRSSSFAEEQACQYDMKAHSCLWFSPWVTSDLEQYVPLQLFCLVSASIIQKLEGYQTTGR